MKTCRKRRSDRNHAIYCITNVITGQQYLGITVVERSVKRSLALRIRKHIQRATKESKPWLLCESIRKYGTGAFTYGLIEVVRGKKVAHERETLLINTIRPELNTFGTKI